MKVALLSTNGTIPHKDNHKSGINSKHNRNHTIGARVLYCRFDKELGNSIGS